MVRSYAQTPGRVKSSACATPSRLRLSFGLGTASQLSGDTGAALRLEGAARFVSLGSAPRRAAPRRRDSSISRQCAWAGGGVPTDPRTRVGLPAGPDPAGPPESCPLAGVWDQTGGKDGHSGTESVLCRWQETGPAWKDATSLDVDVTGHLWGVAKSDSRCLPSISQRWLRGCCCSSARERARHRVALLHPPGRSGPPARRGRCSLCLDAIARLRVVRRLAALPLLVERVAETARGARV